MGIFVDQVEGQFERTETFRDELWLVEKVGKIADGVGALLVTTNIP